MCKLMFKLQFLLKDSNVQNFYTAANQLLRFSQGEIASQRYYLSLQHNKIAHHNLFQPIHGLGFQAQHNNYARNKKNFHLGRLSTLHA